METDPLYSIRIPDLARKHLFSTTSISMVYTRRVERRRFWWNPEDSVSSLLSTSETHRPFDRRNRAFPPLPMRLPQIRTEIPWPPETPSYWRYPQRRPAVQSSLRSPHSALTGPGRDATKSFQQQAMAGALLLETHESGLSENFRTS